jgi:sarcosine oxidase subunit gamma
MTRKESASMLKSQPARGEWMRILPPASRFILHGNAAARRAASPMWGVSFAESPCRAVIAENRATLWLGPDEYLLWDSAGTASDGAATAIEEALRGIPHALVDISHRQMALQIAGPYAESILSGACPLDLDIAEFPIGMCTRTLFAKADIVLWRTGADTFHLEIWRSFAAYVTGLAREIALEFYAAG